MRRNGNEPRNDRLAGDIARLFSVKSGRVPQTATGASGTSQPTGAFGTQRRTGAQHARAREAGRGRHAETPWQIPWKDWKATRQNRFWGQSRGECAVALEWSGSGASGKVTNRVPLALSLDNCQSLPKFFREKLVSGAYHAGPCGAAFSKPRRRMPTTC
jgi:hypothetical protein